MNKVKCKACEAVNDCDPNLDDQLLECHSCGRSFFAIRKSGTTSNGEHTMAKDTVDKEMKKAAKGKVPAAKKNPKAPAVAKKKAAKKAAPAKPEGYKGHRAGSKLEELHKWFDGLKTQPDFQAFNEKAEKLGLAKATARRQFGLFKKAA